VLTLAVDKMRMRPADEPRIIPVRLGECGIPDRDIRGGRTLRSIHRPILLGRRACAGLRRLMATVCRLLDPARACTRLFHRPEPVTTTSAGGASASRRQRPHRPRVPASTWVIVGASWAIVILVLLMMLQRAGVSPVSQFAAITVLIPAFVFVD
jgi:hypothetical protein